MSRHASEGTDCQSEAAVTVRGWVRTRRDSKAGLSFVHLHDGSCFDPIQVVAPAHAAELRERDQEADLRMRGRSRRGALVAEPGQGQAVELQAEAVEVVGWVDDPEAYPIQPKQDVVRIPARGRAPAAADEHARRGRARPPLPQHGDPSLLPRARVLLGAHADRHRERCRRRGRDVPRQHARPRQPRRGPADAGRAHRLQPGLLRQGSVPHRQRSAQRRDLLPGAVEGLHVRPDVPRREQQHQPASGRVLDGRARDRVRRSRRRRRPGRVVPQVHPHGAS